MKKVALINYNCEHNAGASVATYRLQAAFSRRGLEVDLINLTETSYEDRIGLEDWTRLEQMRGYDEYLIADTGQALTLGDTAQKFVAALKHMTSTISVLIHDEYVTITDKDRFVELYSLFNSELNVDTVYGITHGIIESAFEAEFFERGTVRTALLPGSGDVLDQIDFRRGDRKADFIGYSGRVVSRKKMNQLLLLVNELDDIDVELHGTRTPGIFNAKFEAIIQNDMGKKIDEVCLGRYPAGRLPASEYYVTWNGVMIGRGNSTQFIPRVELGTLESWCVGTIPILLKESAPDWLPEDTYIGITWLDINNIRKGKYPEVAQHIRSELKRIQSMPRSEVEELCYKAVKAVNDNWPVSQSYDDYVAYINQR